MFNALALYLLVLSYFIVSHLANTIRFDSDSKIRHRKKITENERMNFDTVLVEMTLLLPHSLNAILGIFLWLHVTVSDRREMVELWDMLSVLDSELSE